MTIQEPDLENSTGEADDPAGLRHRAEEALRKATEAETRATAAERRATFAEAGIPTEGVGALFRKAYDGELTIEAMKTAASEYGILETSKTSEAPVVVPQDDVNGLTAMTSGLASSDNPVTPPQGAAATNLEIVKLAKTGDESALLAYLESQGLIMDPDSSGPPSGLLNQTPHMVGVDGTNPVGVNPQVV